MLIPGYRIDAEASSLKEKLDGMSASPKSAEVHEGKTSETIEVSFVFLMILVVNFSWIL